MKQLELEYPAHNFTTTSKDAWSSKKDKLTKREQVYELLKLNPLSNYQIAEELEMPLSSVCARVRELQLTGHIEDSKVRRKTQFGKFAIVWQKKDQQ